MDYRVMAETTMAALSEYLDAALSALDAAERRADLHRTALDAEKARAEEA
jgi:hypothetical protein